MPSIQFFLRKPVSEDQVLPALRASLGLAIETIDSPFPNAVGLAQVSSHADGFSQGWLITWPDELYAKQSAEQCAAILSIQFGVEVLAEINTSETGWMLFFSDGSRKAVDVRDTDDGIDVLGAA